jgi:hypothetical protein
VKEILKKVNEIEKLWHEKQKAEKTEPSPKFWVVSKMSKGKMKLQQLRKKLQKHQTMGVTR